MEDILDLPVYWHNHIYNLELTGRAELDMAHFYYRLPGPDCDNELLINRATEYMARAKTADENLFEEFLKYCKALHFWKVLSRVRCLDIIVLKGTIHLVVSGLGIVVKEISVFHLMGRWASSG
jgi:hypothetical protein